MKITSRSFRRIAGTAGIIATVLILALLLAPWFIKMAPIENKIRFLVAEHTGDAVTFERVDLSLLPRPRLVVRAVNISFRNMVTGTLQSVHIYPELLPLLLGRIHIAKVHLERPDLILEFTESGERIREQGPVSRAGHQKKIAAVIASIRSFAPELVAEVDEGRIVVSVDDKQLMLLSNLRIRCALPPNGFDIDASGNTDRWGTVSARGRFLSTGEDSLVIEGLSLAGGRSSLSDLSGRLSWGKAPSLGITSGRAVIFLQDLSERLSTVEIVRNALRSVSSLKGTINLASFTFAGPLLHPGQGTMETAGSVANVLVDATVLPGPVKVASGTFKATMDSISVTDAQAALLDASFVTSIVISGLSHNAHSLDMSVTGNTGSALVRWASTALNLPSELTLHAPLSLSQTRFRWQKGGKTSLRGTLEVTNGPLVSADIGWDEQELMIKQFDIQDGDSRATFTLRRRDKLIDASFAGSIHEQTLNRFFEQSSFRHGSIQGDLKMHLVLNHPGESIAQGELVGRDLLVPWAFNTPLDINSIHLNARGKTITIKSSDLTLADMHFTFAGTVTASAQRYLVDGDLGASAIAIETLQNALGEKVKQNAPGAQPDQAPQQKPLPVHASLRIKADSLSYGKFVLSPLQATVILAPPEFRAEHLETVFCGITLRGGLSLNGRDVSVDLKPEAKGLQLEPALACLAGRDHKITGVFDLHGSLSAHGKSDALVSSLQGSAELTAREGRIYEQLTLAKILSVLNVSDLLRGKLPDFRTEGLPYRSISIKTGLRGGEIALREIVIDSSAMNIAGQGVVDLKDSTVRMTVLVAPFTTVDQVVSNIPVVSYIFQGTLVSIPVTVNGGIRDPEVKLLPASAVGDDLLGILKRTLKAPVKVIEPVLPGEKKNKEAGSG